MFYSLSLFFTIFVVSNSNLTSEITRAKKAETTISTQLASHNSYSASGDQIACSDLNTLESQTISEVCNYKVIQFYISVSGNSTYSRRLTFINNGETQYQGFRIGDGDYYFDGYMQINWSTGQYGMSITSFSGWAISSCLMSKIDVIIK